MMQRIACSAFIRPTVAKILSSNQALNSHFCFHLETDCAPSRRQAKHSESLIDCNEPQGSPKTQVNIQRNSKAGIAFGTARSYRNGDLLSATEGSKIDITKFCMAD